MQLFERDVDHGRVENNGNRYTTTAISGFNKLKEGAYRKQQSRKSTTQVACMCSTDQQRCRKLTRQVARTACHPELDPVVASAPDGSGRRRDLQMI